MDLYLLRHGEAEPRSASVAEARRQLTEKGRRDVGRVIERSQTVKVKPGLILSSPYVRARQTADIAAEILKVKVKESSQLLPSVEPHLIWDELREHADTQEIMLVGHEPHMSRLVSFLLMTMLAIDFKKGALIRVEVDNPPAQPHGVLKWILTPKLAGAVK